MFGFLRKKEKPEEALALQIYRVVVTTARREIFYISLGVPDSVDGRFEMISLHAALVMLRLETIGGVAAAALSQALFDHMFMDMDRSLREMGISDLSVPKHMKRMLHGFNGRAQAYRKALIDHDRAALKDAIKRNIYGTLSEPLQEDLLEKMSGYVDIQHTHMAKLTLEDFQNCKKIFIEGL
jgi:cytochrome b pre-mRNA-processing protein 3